MWTISRLSRYLLFILLLFPASALAVDISLQSGQCIFGSTDIFCEGATANTSEAIFTVTDPTAERTFTFPDLSGTVTLQSAAGFTDGSIPFYASSLLSQNNANFNWDNANDLLTIFSTANTPGVLVGAESDTLSPQNILRKGRAGPAAVQNTDTLGAFSFRGYNGSAYTGSKGFFAFIATENWTTTANGNKIQFRNTPNLSTTLTTRMTIEANGTVGIATTSFNSDSILEVAGHITTEGTAPTLSLCGTTPAIVGNDSAGTITIGTGVTTACTVTFAASFANAPACVITGDNTAVTYAITARSTTAFTFSSSADMASDVVAYICIGRG